MIDHKKTITETHSFFPSGEWKGFYTYRQGPSTGRHQMSFILVFSKGKVTGSGVDDVGEFSWKGKYDHEELTCHMTKIYHGRHTVFYHGNVDENGIWGMWQIDGWGTGGFHIWPKGSKTAAEMKAVEIIQEGNLLPERGPRIVEIE